MTSRELHKVLSGLSKAEILKYSTRTCKHGHSFLTHPMCLREELGDYENCAILDIETSGLEATYGRVWCYCLLPLNNNRLLGRVLTPSELTDRVFDRELVRECVEDMRKFDRLITYYGARFDIPFLRTRAVYYKQRFPFYKDIKHTDLYDVIRHKFKLHRNRLETACDFFGIPSKGHRMTPKIWELAHIGDQRALNWIFTHCKEDVFSTRGLHKKIINFVAPKNSSI